jgi:uncharacterized membrane protein YphA (DoxX/SURF4 family)
VLPRPLRFGLFLARIWTGVFFLVTAEWKLNQPGKTIPQSIDVFRDGIYTETLQRALAHPPELWGWKIPLFPDLIENVLLPGASFFAPAILFFEALLGLLLVWGLGVRLFAALGFLLMMAFNLAKVLSNWSPPEPTGVFAFTVHASNWPVTILLLLLCLGAAGRILGLDLWVRAKWPAWLRWIG